MDLLDEGCSRLSCHVDRRKQGRPQRRFMYAVKKGTERVDLKEWEEDNSLWQP